MKLDTLNLVTKATNAINDHVTIISGINIESLNDVSTMDHVVVRFTVSDWINAQAMKDSKEVQRIIEQWLSSHVIINVYVQYSKKTECFTITLSIYN